VSTEGTSLFPSNFALYFSFWAYALVAPTKINDVSAEATTIRYMYFVYDIVKSIRCVTYKGFRSNNYGVEFLLCDPVTL
jgi:hypothetical protein